MRAALPIVLVLLGAAGLAAAEGKEPKITTKVQHRLGLGEVMGAAMAAPAAAVRRPTGFRRGSSPRPVLDSPACH